MARVLQQFVEAPRVCPYLPERRASLEHRLMMDVSGPELDALLERGWRRNGPIYFRPACAPCQECVSIRIAVDEFRLNRVQRRTRARCAHLRVELGPPRVDEERLALYAAWHAFRERAHGWEPSPLDAESYFLHFAFPQAGASELALYEGDRLVGVGICDVTARAWSLVYFFYEPELARMSLGVANVLFSVELARERGIPYVYLGYRVADCESMRYKALFRPHQLLRERPPFSAAARWERAGSDQPERG